MKYPKGIRRLKDEDRFKITFGGFFDAKPDSEGTWQIQVPDRNTEKGVQPEENEKGRCQERP